MQERGARQLLAQGLHRTVEQVMASAVHPASHIAPSSDTLRLQPLPAATRAAAAGDELLTQQLLHSQPALPRSSSAAAAGVQPAQQPPQEAQTSWAQGHPHQPQDRQEAQQAQQGSAVPQQAQQALPAQQDLCYLLIQAARSDVGATAGLTPKLAASFMILMRGLPPGERAEKVRCCKVQGRLCQR